MNPVTTGLSSDLPIAVIGGGATGLAAAYAIHKAGREVRLFEASSRLGGAVKSEQVAGWLIEGGPNSLQENAAEMAQLQESLGLKSERIVANSFSKKRFIVRRGRLRALPASPLEFLGTNVFSLQTKCLALLEIFRRPRAREFDISIARLIDEHFGPEVVNYLLDPFVSGIFAGDPKKLSARLAFPRLWESEQISGSLIRGLKSLAQTRRAAGNPPTSLISFRRGLQTLTDAMWQALPGKAIELGAHIESIIPGSNWKIVWSRGGETYTETVGSVVLALPAGGLAKMTFGSLAERPLASLSEVVHPGVASLFLGFRREQVTHSLDGFGVLIPRVENKKILGVLFSSTLFPGRAPDGHVALTVFFGGTSKPEMVNQSIDELTDMAMAELKELFGINGDPSFSRLHVWPSAIPQYNLGYEKYFETIANCEKNYPGLLIGGQARDGISLPACLIAGLAMGKKAAGK